jgi:hypothetical protein
MEVSGQFHAPAALPPGKKPLVPRGWVGPRTVLDAVVKRKIPSPRRESFQYYVGPVYDVQDIFGFGCTPVSE